MTIMREDIIQAEEERLFHLFKYNILDSEQEKEFDDIVELASQICNVPISLVTMIDESRQWFKARKGMPMTETPRGSSFCSYAIHEPAKAEILEVENAIKDQRFAENPFVKGAPHIRFYAGYPLITPSGHKVGSLCVLDTKPKRLDDHQKFALKVLSQQVVNLLELRLKNQRLNYSLEKAQVIGKLSFFEIDLSNNLWMCSEAFFQMFGIQNKYDFSFKDFESTIYTEDFESTLSYWNECLKNEDFFNFQYRSIHQVTKKVFYVHTRCEIIRDDAGKPTHLIGIIEDVSDKVNREKLLIQQNEKLIQVNLELDNFVYRVYHDLRSPISSAKGLINIIKDAFDSNPNEIKALLNSLEGCLHTEDLLIRNISDYFHNIREPVVIQPIDFETLLHEEIKNYEKEIQTKNIKTTLSVNQVGEFYSDIKRFLIVLNSLISNAVRFTRTDDKPRIIDIKIEATHKEAQIEIKDNGIGIETEHLDKIYNMFYRATDQNPGSGLGLYIAKNAMIHLEGRIKLQSARNVGTTFEIWLPSLHNIQIG